jgi:succinate dehydrogenase hydrophobic anchor subunit
MLAANIVLLFFVVFITCLYCLNMKMPYPQLIINAYAEPAVRFFTYIFLYVLCAYNNVIGLMATIPVVLLHLDYINLTKKKSH